MIGEQERAQADALRARLEAAAASTAGVLVTNLTAAQVRVLLVALLWKAGALTATGEVKPMAEWL